MNKSIFHSDLSFFHLLVFDAKVFVTFGTQIKRSRTAKKPAIIGT